MKKILSLIWLILVLQFFKVRIAWAADPHFELSPASGIISNGTSIIVKIDTGGQAAKSAKAVINFDATKLEVSSIQAGNFFDDISHNIYNTTGQVVINANLSLGSMLESKTGSGTLATMTVNAKAISGTAAMSFDCTQGSSTDSNINDPTPLDIIICTSNLDGSYTLGATASSSASPLPSVIAVGGPASSSAAVAAPIPVTGTSLPMVILLSLGIFLILVPVFL